MKVVITGGPGTGKTRLIKKLKKKIKCRVIPEVARDLIIQASKYEKKVNKLNKKLKAIPWEFVVKSNIVPWRKFVKFQHAVLEEQLRRESIIKDDEIVLLDRSAYDALAYYKEKGIIPDEELYNEIINQKYDLVIYLEPFAKYKKDKERKENRERQLKLCKYLKEVYVSLDMKMIVLPEFSPKKRKNIKMRADKALGEITSLYCSK